ncbi:MAG TPA: beta-propeller fold lactonase family protein [Methylomirabilota bacterium]|nr:beta-propeller fold lactonase family protein [Methylomirabilota bacterium]
MRFVRALAALLLVAAALACDRQPPRFAYVANVDSDDVSAFRVEAGGALTPLGAAVAVTRRPIALLVAPSGRFLYVVGNGGRPRFEDPGGITVLSVDPRRGTPAALATATAQGRLGAAAVTPSGRFLYALQTTPHRHGVVMSATYGVVTFAVDPSTGALTAAGPPLESAPGATLSIDPNGRFLYVASAAWQAPAMLRAFPIDPQTGALSAPTDVAETGALPARMLWIPDRALLYVTDRGGGRSAGSSVRGYVMDRDSGALAEIGGSPFPTGMGAASNDLALAADGRLHVANVDFVSTFLVDATSGALAPAVPSRTRVAGRVGAIATRDDRLYVTVLGGAGEAGRVAVFEPQGRPREMVQVRGSPFSAGRGPVAIVIVEPAR